jgi:predicted RND superfamily exporter protein
MQGAQLEPALFAAVATVLFGAALLASAARPAWVLRFPRSVLLAVLAVSLGAASLLIRLDPLGLTIPLDPSTEPLLPANDPGQQLYRSAIRDFGDDEVYVAALECEEVFTRECLSAIEEVSGPLARLPRVRELISLMDVTSFRYVREEDWIEVRPFIEELPEREAELAELRRRALADPVYRRSIVSEDARAAAINVSFRSMTDAELIDSKLDAAIGAALRQALGGRPFYVSGRPHFKTHVYEGMVRDLRQLVPVGLLGMAAVLWLLLGSWRGVALPLGTALIAILWTFAAMALLGRALTLLTVLLAPTLLAIGSVYAVHVLARFEEEAESGADAPAAVLRCQQHMVAPVTIAGATTVIGFAALLITDVPAVFELGAFAMLGVASVTLLTLSAVPAALVLLPPHKAPPSRISSAASAAIDRSLVALAGRVSERTGPLLLAIGALAAVALMAIPSIEIDTDYLSYFDENDRVRRDFDAVNRLLAGAVPIYVVIEGSGPGSFREPERLRAMQKLSERLQEVEGVTRVASLLDTLRSLNRAFHGDDPAHERIPDTRPAVAELLFMIPKTELQRHLTVNHGRANLVLRTGEVGSAATLRLIAGLEAAISDTPLPEGMQASVTGNAILLARSADGIARGQPLSILSAAAAIFVLIALGLRSPRLGAVAMLPNLLPVLCFFGLLGLGAAPLSLPTSLIGCIALGIAIDDTAHYLVRYRSERRLGAEPELAALRATRFIGRPIVITSLMVMVGFLVVALSDFATLREFGVLTAVTMGLCLLADLVLLPAFLIRTRS